MKRRMFALTLAVLLALSAAGCGGGNQKALVGTWEITDDAGSAYGWGIRFDQDGTFFFAAGAEDNDEELEEAFAAIKYTESFAQPEMSASSAKGTGLA